MTTTPSMPTEDRLCSTISSHLDEDLCDSLQSSPWKYQIDTQKPELLFTKDPTYDPLIVDLGEERFAIEVEVYVRKIVKGSPEDPSCSEAEYYGGVA